MEVKALTGTGIGKVPTDRRVDKARHIANKGIYAIPREAFKKMVKYNVWGLGTALLSAWWKDKALQKQWQDVWYNLGAENKDFWDLYNNAEKGYNRKKAIFLSSAPKNIKAFYTKATGKKISGQRILGVYNSIGAPDWEVELVEGVGEGSSKQDWNKIFDIALKIINAIAGLINATMSKSSKELTEGGTGKLDGDNGNGGFNLGGMTIPLLALVAGTLFWGTKKQKRNAN
jgi:hypothetical protein